jgi:hypothetical protein
MAMLKKVEAEVIVPIGRMGWTVDGLRSSFASLAAQVCTKSWRISVVDGSGADVVERLARAIIPEDLLSFDLLHLSTSFLSDLYYQGVSSSRSKYIAYVEPGFAWDEAQLTRLLGLARQARAHLVVEGDVSLKVNWFDERPEALLPLSGFQVLHTRWIYEQTPGWPRKRSEIPTVRAKLWQDMVCAGAEPFAAVRPRVRPASDSTQDGNQLMLFGDA